MRAVTYDHYGDLDDVLRVREDHPDPKVGPGEALVEVRRASVNPVDWKIVGGGLDGMMEAAFPVVPGWDVAGVVRAVGPDTPEFAPGDEVLAYARKDWVHGGTYAELVTVPVRALAHKPAALDWDSAGALPLAGQTAYRVLKRLEVGPGDTVLVHAAAGGVGLLGVQVARELGARVIGTASEPNHEHLRSLGVEPVAYGDGLVERVRALAPDGVDAVADFVGGVLDATLGVLREGGRHASIADPSVAEHGGSWVWVRPDGEELQWLADLAARGGLTVEVAGRYGLEEVGEAFARSREGHVRGKLVIHVSDD
ncbi:MAG: NADP-dependent oxidoreductase [Micrococcales bacterium]|uniref:NADP-dependent oxidoreductase n=1 Tax=Phycicoccus sp. TaxID=1902410 RepID=UPI0019A7FD28|nr:NADP-dependent oxidoreductase [Phycicoccus sp.]MBD3782566.1 NADP-dependent oxidoreductase [Micrococcales bacterium]HMM94289.1 NADP-dependent oxidoreductase [Phycicoccus sp.]